MRFLLVYSHPVETSFCKALHQTVLKTLQHKGHEIRVLDLYECGFDPVLSRQEHIDYRAKTLNQMPVQAYVDDIVWAQGLIFIYPTWWYGVPAILKGWLDRVWLPHVTFTMEEGKNGIRPNMQHIQHLSAVTTYGAPWWLVKWAGDPGRKTLIRGIRSLCHPRCQTFWLAHYQMDTSTVQSRQQFLAKVERKIASI